jgi:hypothetical protein
MDATENGNHQDDPGGDMEQPPAAIERPRPAINNQAGQRNATKEKENWPQRIEAVCAVLLVVITGFYTYYAAGQLHKMKRSTDAAEKAATVADQTLKEIQKGRNDTHDLAEAAKRQATDAGTLAQAAVDQVALLRDTLKSSEKRFALEQRPYIWFTSRKPIVQASTNVGWIVDSENYGRSPALKLRTCGLLMLRDTNLQPLPLDQQFKTQVPAPSFGNCRHRATNENRTLAPPGGKNMLVNLGRVITQDDVNFINSTPGALIIQAIAEYEDKMGNRYTTTSCDMWFPTGLIVACPYYNDMK